MKTEQSPGLLKRLVFFVIFLVFLVVPSKIGWEIIQQKIDTEKDDRAFLSTCEFYFGNKAHARIFYSLSKSMLSRERRFLCLALIEKESQFKQFACSFVTKTISKGGKETKIKVPLCRGYFQLDTDTFINIAKKYHIKYQGHSTVYDAANNIFVGIIHFNWCLDSYGTSLGLEIYNVGSGNYFKQKIRNPKYVRDVNSNLNRVMDIYYKYLEKN